MLSMWSGPKLFCVGISANGLNSQVICNKRLAEICHGFKFSIFFFFSQFSYFIFSYLNKEGRQSLIMFVGGRKEH